MRVAIVGGGPSGLYLSILLKKSGVASTVDVYEQNAADATFGFGVTLADRALKTFEEADRLSYEDITNAMVFINQQRIDHPGGSFTFTSPTPAGSIERLTLLQILHHHASRAGANLHFQVKPDLADLCASYDLVVGADGTNSALRTAYADAFGTKTTQLNNRFAWYGVDRPYDQAALTFLQTPHGTFVGHYYPYTDSKSTFVAECDAQTWETSRLADMDIDEQKAFVEDLFKPWLEGGCLISNRSMWQQFNVVHNERWVHTNTALIGDALYAAHFSIGSGTRLAMEDSIALASALDAQPSDVGRALESFETERKERKGGLMKAAEASYSWYEALPEQMEQQPATFAMSYMMRTGRLPEHALDFISPGLRDKATAEINAASA